MGPTGHRRRAVVGRDHADGSGVGVHRLQRGEHVQRGAPHEVVRERPAVRPAIHQPSRRRRALEREVDVLGVCPRRARRRPSPSPPCRGSRPSPRRRRCSGESTTRASPMTPSTAAERVGGRGADDRPREQQRVAVGHPGQGRDEAVLLHLPGHGRTGTPPSRGGRTTSAAPRWRPVRARRAGSPRSAARTASAGRRVSTMTTGRRSIDRVRKRASRSAAVSATWASSITIISGVSSARSARTSATAVKRAKRSGSRPGRPASSASSDDGVGPAEIGQHLGPRPQRRGASVGPAAAPPDGEPACSALLGGLLAQRRLADADVAADDEQPACATACRGAGLPDHCQLVVPPHEMAMTPNGSSSHHLSPYVQTPAAVRAITCQRRGTRTSRDSSARGEP